MVLIMCEGNKRLDMQTCEKVRYELQYPRLIRIHPIELLIQTLEPTRQCAHKNDSHIRHRQCPWLAQCIWIDR